MFVVMVTGLFSNGLVVIVYSTKKNKNVPNYFLWSLAWVDFLSCALLHPYIIFKLFNFYGGDVWYCKVMEFFNNSALGIQCCLLFSVAVDRSYAVFRPLRFASSYSRACAFIVLSVATGLIVGIPVPVFYGQKSVVVEYGPLCVLDTTVCHYNDQYQDSTAQQAYSNTILALMMTGLCVMAALYIKISLVVYKKRRVVVPIEVSTYPAATRRQADDTRTTVSSCTRFVLACQGSPKCAAIHRRHTVPLLCIPFKSELDILQISWSQFWGMNDGGNVLSKSTLNVHLSLNNHSENSEQSRKINKRSFDSKLKKTRSLLVRGTSRESDTSHRKVVTFHDELDDRFSRVSPSRKVKALQTASRQSSTIFSNAQRPHVRQQRTGSSHVVQAWKAAQIPIVVTVVFLLSWLPFWISQLLVADSDIWLDQVTQGDCWLFVLLNHLFYINNAVNPFIYTLISGSFRRDLRAAWQRWKRADCSTLLQGRC